MAKLTTINNPTVSINTQMLPGVQPVQVQQGFIERIVEVPVEKIVTVIKEVPVEVRVIEEKIVEVPTIVEKEVIKTVEKIVHVPVEVIKEVKVIEQKIVEKPVEVIRYVESIVDNVVHKVPNWCWCVMSVQTLVIIGLVIK